MKNIKKIIIEETKKELKRQVFSNMLSYRNKRKVKEFLISKVSETCKLSTFRNEVSYEYKYLVGWLFHQNKNLCKHIKKPRYDLMLLEDGEYKFLYKNNILIIKSYSDRNFYNITLDIIGNKRLEIRDEISNYLQEKIDEIKRNGKEASNDYIDYRRYPIDSGWVSIIGRRLETIFSEQINEIITIISGWSKEKDIYHKHGLAFKTGIILHGIPGTGKTSIVKALSSHFNMSLITLNLASISLKDLTKFISYIRCESNKIILLEEIDLLQSEDVEQKKSELLTLLDGADGVDNIVFIATTNYIDKVDERLKRPGRFDNIIEITDINKDLAIKMCESFEVDPEETIHKYDEEYSENEGRYNPSHLQKQILNEYHLKKGTLDIDNTTSLDNIKLRDDSYNKKSHPSSPRFDPFKPRYDSVFVPDAHTGNGCVPVKNYDTSQDCIPMMSSS